MDREEVPVSSRATIGGSANANKTIILLSSYGQGAACIANYERNKITMFCCVRGIQCAADAHPEAIKKAAPAVNLAETALMGFLLIGP